MKIFRLIAGSTLIVMLSNVAVQAADFYFFDGGGGDDLWTTPENWDLSGSVEPAGYPGQSNPTDVVITRTGNGKRARITAGTNVTFDVFTSWSNPGAQLIDDGFDMTGGTVDLVGPSAKLVMGSNENNIPISVNMSGGTITGGFFTLGGISTCPTCTNVDSDGVWNMSGNAEAVFRGNGIIGDPHPEWLNSMGTLNMSDNAMLTVEDLILSATGNGLVNITDDAKIITRGDDTVPLNDFISQGYITGSGVMASYDFDLDQTTLASDGVIVDPLAGDYDDSGEVEVGDLNLVLFNWDQPGSGLPPAWVNQRPAGNVAVDELNGVLFNWGNTSAVATVPEPTTAWLSLVAIGLIGHFVRRGWR